MTWASQKGELGVCKWLYDNGAAEDVTKANNDGRTPMWIACQNGHLSVCKWLFEVGAAADITKANDYGTTPMHIVCENGHLSVCEWLFEVGATADITKVTSMGLTPMHVACLKGQLSVCKWLVFTGALNRPAVNGHIHRATVQRDVIAANLRFAPPALLAWAQQVVAVHCAFSVVLRASVVLPHRRVSPRRRCHLPMLHRAVLEHVGLFLDLETGRRVRNVREFAETLQALGVVV